MSTSTEAIVKIPEIRREISYFVFLHLRLLCFLFLIGGINSSVFYYVLHHFLGDCLSDFFHEECVLVENKNATLLFDFFSSFQPKTANFRCFWLKVTLETPQKTCFLLKYIKCIVHSLSTIKACINACFDRGNFTFVHNTTDYAGFHSFPSDDFYWFSMTVGLLVVYQMRFDDF